MGIRDIRNKARLDLHQQMQVPALYIEGVATPVPCTVRVHMKRVALGGVQGTSFNYAEREDDTPRVIFLRSEIPQPSRNAIVSVAAGEAYSVDHTRSPDGLTIEAEVTILPLSKTVGLPVPAV